MKDPQPNLRGHAVGRGVEDFNDAVVVGIGPAEEQGGPVFIGAPHVSRVDGLVAAAGPVVGTGVAQVVQQLVTEGVF